MSKHVEKLKKQLIELAEVVNSFKSEAVQVKVIERLLDALELEKAEGEIPEAFKKNTEKKIEEDGNYSAAKTAKRPGATKILNQLLTTSFFDKPHSISSIATYCKNNFDSEFKTSELSGILLKLANENKLKRERSNDNNRFEYVRQ